MFVRLMECWAECGPGQLAAAPEAQAAACLASLASCANLLLQLQPALAGMSELPHQIVLSWLLMRVLHIL